MQDDILPAADNKGKELLGVNVVSGFPVYSPQETSHNTLMHQVVLEIRVSQNLAKLGGEEPIRGGRTGEK